MKKLPQKKPAELFKTNLPSPKLEKVELPPEKHIRVDVGFWDTLWLLIKSIVRNKARDAMEGREVGSPINPFSTLFDSCKKWVYLVLFGILLWIIIKFTF